MKLYFIEMQTYNKKHNVNIIFWNPVCWGVGEKPTLRHVLDFTARDPVSYNKCSG